MYSITAYLTAASVRYFDIFRQVGEVKKVETEIQANRRQLETFDRYDLQKQEKVYSSGRNRATKIFRSRCSSGFI